MKILKYASLEVPSGVIVDGNIKDEKVFGDLLSKFDHDHNLAYTKVSVPEEKAYLFQTDISTTNPVAIAQNIEFKLEENVPLAAADAVFYFDILPMNVTGGQLRASVSVVPKAYIEQIVLILRESGISPMAFEVVPKSIAKAVLSVGSCITVMIIHIMNFKTGIYVVSGGVVCFTFTVAWGSRNGKEGASGDVDTLKKEVNRIYDYWVSHNPETSKIEEIILVGQDAAKYESEIGGIVAESDLVVTVGNVWTNAFSLDSYVPPISKADSLDYAVAAGLAMDLDF